MRQHLFLLSPLSRCAGFVCLLLQSLAAWSAPASDLLLIVNPDGKSYTAQHTLSAHGELIVLQLPAGRVSLMSQFSGPERQTFTLAHDQNPEQIALWSGAATTRYRFTDSTSTQLLEDGTQVLHAMPDGAKLEVDDADSLITTVTWVLPDNAMLLSFDDKPHNNDEPNNPGRWQTSANTVSYVQEGGNSRKLTINVQLQPAKTVDDNACKDLLELNDDCAPDTDGDGVPDYRDVCLQESDALAGVTRNASQEDELGCNSAALIVLAGVQFQSGQSYLDVASRDVLDRVAVALQRVPKKLFEISSHTDNAGRVATNQRLSENRADAVRHYLMLRGVGPNQLDARGYGETSPAYDNSAADGRRANRRIELRRLN